MQNLPIVYFPTTIAQLESYLKSFKVDVHEESIEGQRAKLKSNWEMIERQNARRIQKQLSRIFGGRDTSCFISVSEFWVYASSWKDVELIKRQARALGYKNIETFVPKVGDPMDDKKSIDDPNPKHAFACRINKSESLIFGDHSKKWLELHKFQIDNMQDHIIYTYCYNTDARFTFGEKIAASILYAGLLSQYEGMQKEAKRQGKQPPQVNISMKETALDNWTVNLELPIGGL